MKRFPIDLCSLVAILLLSLIGQPVSGKVELYLDASVVSGRVKLNTCDNVSYPDVNITKTDQTDSDPATMAINSSGSASSSGVSASASMQGLLSYSLEYYPDGSLHRVIASGSGNGAAAAQGYCGIDGSFAHAHATCSHQLQLYLDVDAVTPFEYTISCQCDSDYNFSFHAGTETYFQTTNQATNAALTRRSTISPGTNLRFVVFTSYQLGANMSTSDSNGQWSLEVEFDPPADTDGDGLLDSWETDGLDINGDGIIDLDLPAMGADPFQKDLFVEVDIMEDVYFSQYAIDQVKHAFNTSPVPNPEGRPDGIKLHISMEDSDVLPLHETLDCDFISFDILKASYWGTAYDRTHPTNSTHILEAKKRVFRYCIVGNKLHSSVVRGVITGIGEVFGNDFIVAIGGLSPEKQTERAFAVTFMHELGHNLGLDEGGGDDIMFKPNYISVMNYAFESFIYNSTQNPIAIDYSRESMLPLDESNLDETIGIQSVINREVKSNYSEPTNRYTVQVQLNNATWDWNRNLEIERGAEVDLNRMDPNQPKKFEVLNGYNDWANLVLPIGDSSNYADLIHINIETQPMTVELYERLHDNPPVNCRQADGDCQGKVDLVDFANFALHWQQLDCGKCGNVDFTGDNNVQIDDLGILMNQWMETTGSWPELPIVDNPAFNPPGGSYESPLEVVITCSTPDVEIHYTTDGSMPTQSDSSIASGDSVSLVLPDDWGSNTILRARAWKTGMQPSFIKRSDYQKEIDYD